MKVLIVIVLASLACSQVSAADPAVLVVTNQINTLLGTIQTFVSDVVNAKFDDITNGAAVMKAQSGALKVLIQIFPTYLLIGNSLFEILVNIVTTIAAAVADAIQKITDALGANVINAITNVLGQILGSSKPTSTLVAIATALFNGLSKAFGDFKTNLLAALATLNTLQAKDIQAQFVAALNSLLLLIGNFNTFAQLFPLLGQIIGFLGTLISLATLYLQVAVGDIGSLLSILLNAIGAFSVDTGLLVTNILLALNQ